MHITMHIMHVCIVRRFSHVKIVCIVVYELVLYTSILYARTMHIIIILCILLASSNMA